MLSQRSVLSWQQVRRSEAEGEPCQPTLAPKDDNIGRVADRPDFQPH
ncbi:hypothetical protein CKA32_002126 [Geitlerinema sp. FC II]|nr:hypothetical protein [Geitlerinema sp. CS-897]PPT11112.1 hypothetical protein CKA32_002126 [Geitlerinema sp. FC II]